MYFFYVYLKWEVMSERFINLFNPVSYLKVFISLVQEPLSWLFVIIFIFSFGPYYFVEKKI
jgi:hypothetical protein